MFLTYEHGSVGLANKSRMAFGPINFRDSDSSNIFGVSYKARAIHLHYCKINSDGRVVTVNLGADCNGPPIIGQANKKRKVLVILLFKLRQRACIFYHSVLTGIKDQSI